MTTMGMEKTTTGTTPSPPPSTMTTATGMTTTTTIGTTTMPPSLTTTTTIAPCSSSNGLRSNDLRLPSGVRELCHYPPLIHSCGSRGSSCCAATVSTTHCLNCQPTLNDVSSSSKAWSHVYSQRKSILFSSHSVCLCCLFNQWHFQFCSSQLILPCKEKATKTAMPTS